MANKPTFPVAKNGKFIGYADAAQIAANKSLEIFDEEKARVAAAKAVVEDAEKQAKTRKASEDAAAGKTTANPAAVKKAPGK